MQLFYNQDINISSDQISFTKEESRHIVKVLRKNSLKITGVTASKEDLEIDVKMS